ncbi:membrane dipeptidase [Aeoliella mucimassa]|uniref:Inositol 2-dehydrogenase/D-chiro-inositol 3-dehydrogenase n=1 Tax=Aeoliella mucimassa TaxID=2527972 RepID=A0A518AQ84_9BACT|nr:membrane dipeptidase [Aeoliella mucimassa]QDU56877.1 Inositol 2-dehydrogenase/D-chiro-inositol 3-dehydrogenase [Aeoliella mucimassa]
MIPLIDSHLDLAWNAVSFDRDLTATAEAINASERQYTDCQARGGAVVSFEEMRRGDLWLCYGTLLARNNAMKKYPESGALRIDLDHRQWWGAYCSAHAQLAWYRKMVSLGHIRMIKTRADLDAYWNDRQSHRTKALGMVLVMEGADPITDRDDLVEWYTAGLRQVNLVHYGTNRYAAGTGAEGGVTPEGRQLLQWCSELGMALDLTHLADQAFFEALDAFDGPVLASHQNARSVVPGGRQFTDEQLKLVIERQGVIGAAFDNWMLVEGWKLGVTPRESVTLESVANHIDHICQLAGTHTAMAIGTDLDGGFGTEQSPYGLESIADVQNLAEVLANRNYSTEAIEAIFHGNWLRWLRANLPGEPSQAAGNEEQTLMEVIRADSLPRTTEQPRKLVAVIGAGSIGERHARCFAKTGRASIVLCDINRDRMQEVASRVEIASTIDDFSRLADLPLDAAVIATPAPYHIPQAIELLQRRVPVLIEKPLSLTTDGIAELVELAEKQAVPTAVAYVLRGHAVYAAVKECVQRGEIGTPVELLLQSGQHFPFYRPAYRETYYAKRASGGGAIQDALTHFVNLAEWIVGPTTAIQADASRLMLDGVDVEDTVHVLARHGQVMSSLTLNQHQPANETSLSVIGTTGMVRGEVHSNSIHLVHRPDEPWQVTKFPELERDHLFVKQADSFLDQIELGTPAVCSLLEAVSTLKTQMAILQAADHTSWTSVTPGKPRGAAEMLLSEG